MAYTLGEASKATSKSKATISKAIKSGRISASKNENGVFEIDPSELHRVYPPVGQSKHIETLQVNRDDSEVIKELRARIDTVQERLSDKDTVISDLREDRDKWRQQATALLEDRRTKGFWARLTGR